MIRLEKNEYMKIVKTGEKPKMDINKSISQLVANVKKETENYVSDKQYYRSIDKSIANNSEDLYCKAFGLTVEQTPDNSDRHFLILNMLHPKMRIQTSRTLAAGNKQEIVEFLQKDDINNVVKTNLYEMSENLKER